MNPYIMFEVTNCSDYLAEHFARYCFVFLDQYLYVATGQDIPYNYVTDSI